jgi:hypothetical protein
MKRDTDYSNDNEPDPWSSIGLQAAMILNKLRVQAQLESHQKQHDEEDENRTPDAKAEENRARDSEYIEQRLKELARFERRAIGNE